MAFKFIIISGIKRKIRNLQLDINFVFSLRSTYEPNSTFPTHFTMLIRQTSKIHSHSNVLQRTRVWVRCVCNALHAGSNLPQYLLLPATEVFPFSPSLLPLHPHSPAPPSPFFCPSLPLSFTFLQIGFQCPGTSSYLLSSLPSRPQIKISRCRNWIY